MKKELKELLNVIALLIATISLAPLRAWAILLIANLFSLTLITQFSFAQILGIVCILKLIIVEVSHKGIKEEDISNSKNNWKNLGIKVLHIVMSIVIAYMFFGIFN